MIEQLASWLKNTPLAMSVAENWFSQIESVHVIALALVAGTIFTVDARLLGLASRNLGFTYLSKRLLPWTWFAFVLAALSGGLMFTSDATRYVKNTPFLIKMSLLVLAGLNMAYFQFVTLRGVSRWDVGRPVRAARVAGALSILLWTAIITCGRWIGFV